MKRMGERERYWMGIRGGPEMDMDVSGWCRVCVCALHGGGLRERVPYPPFARRGGWACVGVSESGWVRFYRGRSVRCILFPARLSPFSAGEARGLPVRVRSLGRAWRWWWCLCKREGAPEKRMITQIMAGQQGGRRDRKKDERRG